MSKERDEVAAMFEAAHNDPQLKKQLLSDPQRVAKEWGVKLDKVEISRLRQLGSFIDMVDEVQHGSLYAKCDPRVCYPVTVWQRQKIFELIRDFKYIIDWKNPIFYPAPIDFIFEGRPGMRRR